MTDKKNVPRHVGIIMDGNRRWARERNLPTIEGHRKGYGKLKQVPEWFFNLGVEVVSAYAFSTENWSRSREEVNYLMKLMKKALTENFEDFNKKNIKLIFSGRIDELPGDLPEICGNATMNTKENTKGILNICLNYGGRAEIVDAIKRIVKKKISMDILSEEMVKKYLYNGNLGDPDIIVRTSGEKRLSGFQLWESVYSELYFMDKYWPDFEKADAANVVDEYNSRKRRFGGE
jgi:undecaprenyl diphosphate synthase